MTSLKKLRLKYIIVFVVIFRTLNEEEGLYYKGEPYWYWSLWSFETTAPRTNHIYAFNQQLTTLTSELGDSKPRLSVDVLGKVMMGV